VRLFFWGFLFFFLISSYSQCHVGTLIYLVIFKQLKNEKRCIIPENNEVYYNSNPCRKVCSSLPARELSAHAAAAQAHAAATSEDA